MQRPFPPHAGLTAFVSSHSSLKNLDGVDFQQVACAVAASLGITARCMDSHPPSTDLERRCRDSVRDSDILILILGWRYGRFDDQTPSLTEIECSTAESSDKEIVALMYDGPPPSDIDPVELARAAAFRQRFDRPGSRPLYGSFTDPAAFERRLTQALSTIITEQSFRVLGRGAHEVSDVIALGLEAWAAADLRRVPLGGRLSRWKVDPAIEAIPDFMREIAEVPESEPELVVTAVHQATDCLRKHQRLIVYGEFGCGKSNLLEALRLDVARLLLANSKTARVPLLLNVGAWDPGVHTFRSFVDLAATAMYGNRVAGNDLFLLLDGVDNRQEPLDDKAVREIIDWLAVRPRAWAAVAVRQVDGVAQQLLDARLDFVRLGLDPMEPAQRAPFVLKNAAPGAARDQLLAFIKQAETSGEQSLLRILESPFNLYLLSVFTFGARPIPRNASLVLRARIRAAYLKEASASPPPGGTTPERFLNYVGGLAVRALGGRLRRQVVGTEEAAFFERVAAAVDVWSKTGGHRIWTGRYLSYFAAEALVADEQLLANIHPSARYSDRGRIASRLDGALHDMVQLDPSWFGELAACDPCLAPDCLRELAVEERATAARNCFSLLLLMLSADNGSARSSAVEAIAALGEYALPLLAEAMTHEKEYWLRKRLVTVINRIGGAASTQLILAALNDPHKRVVAAAERAILAFDTERRSHVEAFIDKFAGNEVSDDDQDRLRRIGGLDPEFGKRVDAVLGQEMVPEAALVVPAPESQLDDNLDDDSCGGQELLEQLRAAPGSAETARRARRWLQHSTLHDKTWPRIWSQLWDTGPDAGLESLALTWLRAVPDSAGPWGHVWTRLFAGNRENQPLAELGRRWLRVAEPLHHAWSHVWALLFKVAPSETLRQQAMKWLQQAREAPVSWTLVWTPLREYAGDPETVAELENVAERLLKMTAPGDLSWGFVLPALCRRGASSDVLELGRTWLEVALPDHPGWGYIFPTVWKANPGDARVESAGRDWLAQGSKRRRCWSSIWEALFETRQRDTELVAVGLEFLAEVPPNYHGWARVWQMLWNCTAEREPLEALAHVWLGPGGGSLDHHGWPWVFTALSADSPPAHDLTSRGIEYLRSPRREGWASVWRAVWDSLSAGRLPKEATHLEDLSVMAREWLNGIGAHDPGFSRVWEVLWQQQPNAELRGQALTRLRRHPSDRTLRHMWERLTAVLWADPEVKETGRTLLRSLIPATHPQWALLWQDVWVTAGDAEVTALAKSWLASFAGVANDWQHVWKVLWGEEGPGEGLISIAVQGLEREAAHQGPRAQDDQSWCAVWPRLWQPGIRDPGVIAAAVDRLRRMEGALRSFWIKVGADLASAGLLPDDLRTLLAAAQHCDVGRPEELADLAVTAPDWPRQWKRAWEESPGSRARLWEPATAWLGANGCHEQFADIWRLLLAHDLETEALVQLGLQWLRCGDTRRKGWGFVFAGVARAGHRDSDVLSEARQWLGLGFERRSSWPLVWAVLWDFDLAKRPDLLKAAWFWLTVPATPRRRDYAAVWSRLWDEGGDHARLRSLGRVFVSVCDVDADREQVEHRLALIPGDRSTVS